MEIRQINRQVSVSPQIRAGDVALIAQQGFRSIICNRPNDEEQGQPSADTIGRAAKDAALEFAYVPAVSGSITPEDVKAMAHALAELPQPVLAYCRSGARSTHLYAFSRP